MTPLESRLLASKLVLKIAVGDPTKPQSMQDRWQSYIQPFQDNWSKAWGVKADPSKNIEGVKPNPSGAFMDLLKQRPGTVLGGLGMGLGGLLGATSDDSGSALRWAAVLGLLGAGGGMLYKNRDAIGKHLAEWLRPHISGMVQQEAGKAGQQFAAGAEQQLQSNPAYRAASWIGKYLPQSQ